MEKLKSNDLRIGNFQQTQKGDILEVILISKERTDHRVVDRDKFPFQYKWQSEPIPLTEDWLIRFGFAYDKKRKCWDKDGFIISTYPNGFHILIAGSDYELKYIHTLQNAYALTNEELTIKTD